MKKHYGSKKKNRQQAYLERQEKRKIEKARWERILSREDDTIICMKNPLAKNKNKTVSEFVKDYQTATEFIEIVEGVK